MTQPLFRGGILGGVLMPSTTGPRRNAAPEVNKPTLVPGRAGDPDLAKAETAKRTSPSYIGPVAAAAVPISGINRADLVEAGFRTVKKSRFTPPLQKKDSNMSYAETVSAALAAAGGRMSRDALSTATGLTGKKLENAMTRARMAGLAHRDGSEVVAGAAPEAGTTPKKPRAKPTKRVAKPATVLAKAEATKGTSRKATKRRLKLAKVESVRADPKLAAEAVARPPLRFIPCGPGASEALAGMIADSTRAIITAERGAIIVVGDRVEHELTPAAMAALAKATAEARV